MPVNNFTVIESDYGKFIVNRHCSFQAEALIKTGKTHIEAELANIFAIVDRLPPQALFLDGGANIGFVSIPVAQRIKDKQSHVISFEPQRPLFYALAGSIALNDLSNCHAHNLALSDVAGNALLPAVNYSQANDFGLVSIQADAADPGTTNALTNERLIKTVRVDELNLPRLDFFKLDVEGHEVKAITGALQTIARHRPFLWVEWFLIGEAAIRQALATISDYEFFIVDPQNMLCAPKEKLAAMGLRVAAPPAGAAS